MVINKIPVMELQQTEVTLSELLSRFQGQTVGFQLQNGDLSEGPDDYWEWRTRYKSALVMEERFGSLLCDAGFVRCIDGGVKCRGSL